MQIRRRYTAVLAGLGALITATPLQTQAATPTAREDSLLGVRLLSSYKALLQRFGQPAEIQVGMPEGSDEGAGGAAGGAMPGMGGGPMGMPGGGMPGMPMGMPGSGGGMGIPGSGGPSLPGFGGSGGGRPSGMPGMMGGGMPGSGGPGGMPGMPMGMPGSGGGMGMPRMGGRMGGMGGGMTGGGGGDAAANGLPTLPGSGGGPSQETIWWYKYPQQGLFYAFLLNKQGQVIQIQAHGYKPDAKTPTARTAKGITLGAPFGSVLKNYGWSSDGEHVGEYLVMRYDSRERIGGGHGRLAFQVMRNQVVGITVGYVK